MTENWRDEAMMKQKNRIDNKVKSMMKRMPSVVILTALAYSVLLVFATYYVMEKKSVKPVAGMKEQLIQHQGDIANNTFRLNNHAVEIARLWEMKEVKSMIDESEKWQRSFVRENFNAVSSNCFTKMFELEQRIEALEQKKSANSEEVPEKSKKRGWLGF